MRIWINHVHRNLVESGLVRVVRRVSDGVLRMQHFAHVLNGLFEATAASRVPVVTAAVPWMSSLNVQSWSR